MSKFDNIMHNSDSCLLDFDRACDELMSAKLVLSDKKISNLLQVIAGSKKLYALIENCLIDFDFSKELKIALSQNSDTLETLSVSNLPRKKQIAFVFCLLYSIDTKKIVLQEFIHSYFLSNNIASEYDLFCKSFILPFRKNVGEVFIADDDSDSPEVASVFASTTEIAEKATKQEVVSSGELAKYWVSDNSVQSHANCTDINEINTTSSSIATTDEKVNFNLGRDNENTDIDIDLDGLATNALLCCIREIIGIVAREVNVSTLAREELLIICEAFEQAVEYSGLKSIRIMYIGLKNTIACSPLARFLSIQSDSLANLIKEYNIL